jgi:adenylylsulfate kinase
MGQENIFPQFNSFLNRNDKEELLKQQSKVIWFTGLSGAGKSTIGMGVEKKLYEHGFLTQVLDGDIIRSGINNNLGFSEDDRLENIRRIAEVSKLFIHAGVITINCFISPTKHIRDMAKDIIGRENFLEIFVDTPLEICEQRDTKGLYKKARKGLIQNFTGITSPFDNPVNPDYVVTTQNKTVEQSVNEVLNFVLPILNIKQQR